MNGFRSQLSPGWSGVNIALMVVLFVIAWPLGLLMIAYIVWGRQLGLDFARPETLSTFGGRLRRAWHAAAASWRQDLPLSTGTPGARPAERVDARDATSLQAERDALERERQAFEAEKRERGEHRGPLDS